MSHLRGTSETVALLLTSSASGFKSGAISLTIPSAVAERSVLITELRQQLEVEEEVLLPLPLLLQDLGAWLSFANSLLDLNAADALKPALCHTNSRQDDERLIGVLKVRGYARCHPVRLRACALHGASEQYRHDHSLVSPSTTATILPELTIYSCKL